jgi:uncharacterized protein (TIGR02145 family)
MGFVVIIGNGCSYLGLGEDQLEDPVIIWENPADIGFGTRLDTLQLNAKCDLEGTYFYYPEEGTVLDIGVNQVLEVTFDPDDINKYNSVKKTVIINVLDIPAGIGGVTSAVFNSGKTYGTLTDIDGNFYKTITIGTQTWMAENLRTTHYRNGNPIPTGISAWEVTATGAYSNYNYSIDKDIIATYGRLYNWYAVSDSRFIAPEGWHIPSDAEWTTLMTYLGGDGLAGGKLKEAGMTHWTPNNAGATNESGFTALPAGLQYPDGMHVNIGTGTVWWSSTTISSLEVSRWYPFSEYPNLNSHSDPYKEWGFSVRCIKD